MTTSSRVILLALTLVVFGSLISFRLASTDFVSTVVGGAGEYYYTTTTSSSKVVSNNNNKDPPPSILLLPDWRITTDCSLFDRACVLRRQNTHRYADYPFHDIMMMNDTTLTTEELPANWNQSLQSITTDTTNRTALPPPPSSPSILQCVNDALSLTIDQQLDQILLNKDSSSKYIAFTISDYSYSHDMMLDFFSMSNQIVLGEDSSLFMVAMDQQTVQLCCHYQKLCLAWPQKEEEETLTNDTLKSTVANTKFDISYRLLQRNIDFVFFEMDVWFVQSLVPTLQYYHTNNVDMIFSSHQDNPNAINIGVYSILANNATREFFQLCIHILSEAPYLHDQRVMQQVQWWHDQAREGKRLREDGWLKPYKPELPTIQHAANISKLPANMIASSVWPVATQQTLAIHTLCGSPLRAPHGKKQIAKELGAWYGGGSYYSSTTSNNRYLFQDSGQPWNGLSTTMSWSGYYHKWEFLQWQIAISIALANFTNRIWVMPKVIHDTGLHFLWVWLDMESVEEILGVSNIRETNFPSNPKAWQQPGGLPFDPVARSAVTSNNRLLVQLDAHQVSNSGGGIHAYKVPEQTSSFDAYFGIHHVMPELEKAQVLLTGLPDAIGLLDQLRTKIRAGNNLSVAETEIRNVWKNLRWCGGWIPNELYAGRANADNDCYGKGVPVKGF